MIKKILVRSSLVIVALLVLVSIATILWLRSSISDYDGEQPVPGLSADVTIMRDENAFAHIFAETLNDAYTGLGYVHAQDRLWQLELMKRVSSGRLAEIIGEDGLEYDFLAHTLNLAGMGRISGERMNQETKAATASYVSGINAYIDSHSGAWPLEFILLGVEPSRWSVNDSLTMAGIGMFGMPNWEDELVNARLSLHAGVACKSNQRKKLEHLCRYVARPAISEQRLSLAGNGNVIVALKTPYDDGTSHVVLSPLEFMGRLAALVPKPRVNLTRFHGVFSPNSKLREFVVPRKSVDDVGVENQSGNKAYSMTWAQRLKRVFAIEIEKCEKCGGKVNIIASIEDPEVIEKILKHLGLDEASQVKNRSPPVGLFGHSGQLF